MDEKKYNTGVLSQKAYCFALRMVNAYKYLTTEQKEFVLSKQMLRSGTSIGANCQEAVYAQSLEDFIHKLSVSLKEANETLYWINLLHDADYISNEAYNSVHNECTEIVKLLTAIVKTSKQKIVKS